MVLPNNLRRTLVHAMDLEYAYSVYLLDNTDTILSDITDKVYSCKITHDSFKTVHRSIVFDTSAVLRWGRDRIKVVINLSSNMLNLSDSHSMGVFIPTWPEGTRKNIRQVVGYDKMWLLDHNLATNLTIVEDEPILSFAKNVLATRGIYEDAIDSSRGNDVTSTVRTWNADDEANKYSTVVNNVVGMVGYAGVFMTGDGLPRSIPYVVPELQPLSWLYSAGELDNIIDGADEGNLSNNNTDIPNRWRFYRNDNDQRETVPTEGDGYFFFDNHTEGPNSQQSLGLVIPKTVPVDASSQADLESIGLRIVAEDIRGNEQARFRTFLNPYHGHLDVLNLQEHLLGAVGRFQHISWEADLDNGRVDHTVRRVQGGIT